MRQLNFLYNFLPGLVAQFFAHVNCLKKMSKNLSFVKNQLFAHFLQPKKMSKNLSSGFTVICSIATCQSLFTDQPFSRQGCLKAHSDEC